MNTIVNGGGEEGILIEVETNSAKTFEFGTFVLQMTPR
jgi:hypothetical protein